MTEKASFLFPPTISALPIEGLDVKFPVGRIWCVGRNYAEHSREMRSDPERNPPFFFTKPSDNISTLSVLPFPPQTQKLHYEVELVVALNAGGTNLSPEESRRLIYGYAVGLDMTRRDMQEAAKNNRHPWSLSKGFDNACPISAIRPASLVGEVEQSLLTLTVNGDIRQSGRISDMIWSIPDMISVLSYSVTLRAGDLIMTGTPAGVGQVNVHDILEARCENVGELTVSYE
ncbi:fumarylacetoacetate hydrolase family protein [Acetobacter sp.]|jgi:fumarylpyruvate hydrolase|uniref:fumarylacetoacetate hydrolase family protein n=1 Tax=Acetobacter sp. TaxID=440 RepID=UPI0025C10855|nr:fumarylacetoacetate hydrolase family protein [Acetobacter sp.]MCH4089919.1 fumarylacetoacetate hydrolase family protein [Acetobacter sp.]MCI1298615.1 fumarylacetoacetate hydrolase family protein [Acetobacter sp.]MCI1315180.1 fumarylacetoacetate hydrolase family protein [Acetobacter sp.]